MFNHLCGIRSKTVFMENANFMIFLIYEFSYIFYSMYAWPSSLKMKQFLIIYVSLAYNIILATCVLHSDSVFSEITHNTKFIKY